MLSSPLLVLASFLCFLRIAFAAPDPLPTSGQSMPLSRRRPPMRSVEDWATWAKNEREMLRIKYGGSPHSRRDQGTNLYGLPFFPVHSDRHP